MSKALGPPLLQRGGGEGGELRFPPSQIALVTAHQEAGKEVTAELERVLIILVSTPPVIGPFPPTPIKVGGAGYPGGGEHSVQLIV